MKKGILAFTFILICLLTLGCKKNSDYQKLSEDENGNLILLVSNQSIDISPVDIKMYIDDTLAINDKFEVGNQHNYKSYRYNLIKGEHSIKISSGLGDATLDEKIKIADSIRYAKIDYWYYSDSSCGAAPTQKHFTFTIQNKTFLIY